MEYSEELSRTIDAAAWQCTNCKTCSICNTSVPSQDEQMLFCDSCDLGYHMPCHRPPLHARPLGKWVCFRCFNASNNSDARVRRDGKTARTASHRRRRRSSHGNKVPRMNGVDPAASGAPQYHSLDADLSRFLPCLPPQLHPSTGLLPPDWEEYPVDAAIPDVSDWSATQVSGYLSAQGFPSHMAEVFQKEVSGFFFLP